ncbi:hypothetical protein AAJ76_240005206 [Vairimorpha ceranae]|uniref:Uncharacterized protein n=1 Tax=Vairimorpha ceranae TaxID=40302 RepID=A0A0F9WQW4_9MICR|nr:hypothetical protein AAJ76_240005206 [Vairimorpha ceranae]KKO75313.1 hypothetical protein AAJ76_240005206 [Vairimorpha ceranae]
MLYFNKIKKTLFNIKKRVFSGVSLNFDAPLKTKNPKNRLDL